MAVPQSPDQLDAHYDVTLSRPDVNAAAFAAFDRYLTQACGAWGLSCALIHQGIVREAIQRIHCGRLTVGFHLDYFSLWHVPDDPYAALAFAVAGHGGMTVNPPTRAGWFTNKAAAHLELVRARLGVPESLVVRPGVDLEGATFPTHCYIKPANGFGGRGVVCVDAGSSDAGSRTLQAVRAKEPMETFLVQRAVCPPQFVCDDGVSRPAYWRVLYCFGKTIALWWNQRETEYGRYVYRRVTEEEFRRFAFRPILSYTRTLANLSGLNWFSTELCLSDSHEPSLFHIRTPDGRDCPVIAIDYINDQCDVDVQSRSPIAPPDDVVEEVARQFAKEAMLHASKGIEVKRMRVAI